MACLTFAPAAFADEILPANTLELSKTQQEQLQQDTPFADMFIDGERSVWVAGREYVWKWSPLEKRLQRIKIRSTGTANEPLRLIRGAASNVLAVATDRVLSLITLEPFVVTRYEHPSSEVGATHNLIISGDDIIWMHQNGVVKINNQTRKVENLKQDIAMQKNDLSYLSTRTGMIWLARGPNLLVRSVAGQQSEKLRLVHKDRSQIRDLECNDTQCFALTDQALLRFQNDGKLAQGIPVKSDKKLLAMDIGERQHIFLFDDAHVQVQDLGEKNSFVIDLGSKDIVVNLRKLAGAHNMLAVLQDNDIHVFHVPRL